ncbi:Mcm10/DnaG-type zinc finger protein [Sporobolomyces koalae]|uniref:Mcm10/DnaG-type zinc finger protein n=1 Tax=Sporobolomyces koalae TaxID=500713 RepID=UPI00317B7AEC
MSRDRSSSPFDPELLAQQEAALARQKDKQRKWQLKQDQLAARSANLLVADSPSPRKKRRDVLQLEADSSRPQRPAYFDSTLSGPPPPLVFKSEASVSIVSREPTPSRFASHESALPRSFVEKMQAEQETAKLDAKRKALVSKRSTGFNLGPVTTSSSAASSSSLRSTGAVSKLMNARTSNDLRVRANRSKDLARKKPSDDGDSLKDVKPLISAMTRPKSQRQITAQEDKPVPIRRQPSPTRNVSESDDDDDELDITDGPTHRSKSRNKDGTIIEELEMGPKDFVPPKNDPLFERIEPNSGIKLRERIVSHDQVQALLSDRYHLTPSQIYSLARIDTRRQVHVDVDADFVIIGVLAWKDEIRFLNSNPLASEPRKPTDDPSNRSRGGRQPAQDPLLKEVLPDEARPAEEVFLKRTKRQRQQRYIRFELIDLSTERAAAAGTGTLNVMLIESDSIDTGYDEDGNQVPVYKGQSGGAYEKFWKESPGAVVAIINPAFLPHSQGRSHTLKPLTADSMVVLGRAKDLTFCDAIRKKDGNKCNSWVDARVGTKCQYHVHLAVARTGVGRAETSSNTASLRQTASIDLSKLKKSLRSTGTLSQTKKKPGTAELNGLGSGASGNAVVVAGHHTYVAGGSRSFITSGPSSSSSRMNATRSSRSDLDSLMPGGIGLPTSRGSGGFIPGVRDGPIVTEERKKKERERLEREKGRKELKELGQSDRGQSLGGEYLILAREQEKAKRKKMKEILEREREAKKKRKEKSRKRNQDDHEEQDDSDSGDSRYGSISSDDNDEEGIDSSKKQRHHKERRKVFSSEAVRMIGYNPASRPGDVKDDPDDEQTLQQRLALEGGVRQPIKLSAPVGQTRVVSGVTIDPGTVPPSKKRKETSSSSSSSSKTANPKSAHEEPQIDNRHVQNEGDDDDLLIEGGPAERIKVSQ